MKIFVFLLALGCVSASSFHSWKRTHGKVYATSQEEIRRQLIFDQNKAKIASLNNMQSGAEFALNEFADMTESEFIHSRMMSSPPPFSGFSEDKFRKFASNDLPASVNWEEKGAVGPVRDQGSVGTCWAFSATEAIQSASYLKAGGDFRLLSVEQITECDSRDCGVFGGWPYQALEYVQSVGGIVSEDSLSYCAGIPFGKPGNCEPCMAPNYNVTLCGDHSDLYCNHSRNICPDMAKASKAASVKSWFAVSEDEKEIASALLAGPLSIGLNATPLQFYHKGIMNPFNFMCSPDGINHAVLLIGYGTEKNKDYWIVRNSWGSSWGEQGNFRIVRGVGKCGLNKMVVGVEVN